MVPFIWSYHNGVPLLAGNAMEVFGGVEKVRRGLPVPERLPPVSYLRPGLGTRAEFFSEAYHEHIICHGGDGTGADG